MTRGLLHRCAACGIRPIAWSSPRVEYCYDCLPGGPFPAPPCRRCGSPDYYSSGLCSSCHHLGNLTEVRSCSDCLAWGARSRHGWLCTACSSWRTRFPAGTCISCSRNLAVNEVGACRLCWQQASQTYATGAPDQVIAANRNGQQLIFANLARITTRRREPPADLTITQPVVHSRAISPESLHLGQQLIMFEATRDMRTGQRAGFREPADTALARYLMLAADDHGNRFGWGIKATARCKRGIRIVLGLQDASGLRARTSDINALR